MFEKTKALISRLGNRGRIMGQFVTNTQPWFTTHRKPTTHDLLKRVAGDVYSCASVVAAAVAEAAEPELFVRKLPNGGKFVQPTRSLTRKECTDFRRRGHVGIEAEDLERVLDHPLLDLLHTINPLPFVGPYEFFEQISLFSDVARFFALIVKDDQGMPVELWTLPPGPMVPKLDSTNLISHWEYHTGATPIRFETDEILFHRRAGAAEDMRELIMGFPPLQAVFETADSSLDLTRLMNNTIENRAVPPLIVTVEGANEPKLERIKTAWNRSLRGKKSGSTVFIPDSIKAEPVGWNPKDLQFSQLLKDNRERICNAFNVPISFFTDANSNLANAHAGIFKMMRFAVRPRLRRLADTLNQTLVPMFDDSGTLVISFPDPVPQDQQLEIQRNVAYVGTILTPNEIRQELDREPLPDGDKLKPQISPMPFGQPGGGVEPPEKSYSCPITIPLLSRDDNTGCTCTAKSRTKQIDGPGQSPQAPGLETALVKVFNRQRDEVLARLE